MSTLDTPDRTGETSVTTNAVTSEISITAKPILGLRYLNKRTRVDILNFQVYVPESQKLPQSNDDYNYKLDRILPRETLEDLEDISEFNCIDPEVISQTNNEKTSQSFGYTPKIRLIEKTEYYDKLYGQINISRLKPLDSGIDYCKFKFILSELKLQYKNAKKWHELVHIAIEIPKVESQKIHINEAKNLLDSGNSIQNFISLPLFPKLVESIAKCTKYMNQVDEFFKAIDSNPSPLETGSKLLQTGSQLPFITDQYLLIKNVWESHIDRTHQINSAMYRNDYLRVAMLTQDDFKLNIPYIKQIYNEAKIVIWLEQIKKMVAKTPRYTDVVKILSINLNNPRILNNSDKLELENRCIGAKKWLETLSKSPVSQLVITGVKELIMDDNYKKGKQNKIDGEESLKYFTIFKDDTLVLNSDLIDENNPFYNQDLLIQSLGGIDSIINSTSNDSDIQQNTPKPHPKDLENFNSQLTGIKLVIWCNRFLEPLLIKYRKFTRRFKRAIDGGMSKIEIVILLQDADLLSQQLQMDEHIDALKSILNQANEYESKCKRILDTRHSAVSQFEVEKLVEPWISFETYRKQDIITIEEIYQFIRSYKSIPGVDISAIDQVISQFDNQTIKNYPLMKELNDARSIYTNWMEKMEQVLNDPGLSNADLNRSIILLLDARKHGINFDTAPLLLNLKCYIVSNNLVESFKGAVRHLENTLNLLKELECDKRYDGKIVFHMNQMQFLDDQTAAERHKYCITNGIEHYITSFNSMCMFVGDKGAPVPGIRF